MFDDEEGSKPICDMLRTIIAPGVVPPHLRTKAGNQGGAESNFAKTHLRHLETKPGMQGDAESNVAKILPHLRGTWSHVAQRSSRSCKTACIGEIGNNDNSTLVAELTARVSSFLRSYE